MSPLLAERLRQRVGSNGSAPLLTYYDLDSGERTELSAISFRNWVDKTSNMLVDDLAVDQGDVISMPLAVEAPGHWLTAVWQLASWQVGLVVDLTNPPTPAAVVTGRQWRGSEGPEVTHARCILWVSALASRFQTAYAIMRSRCAVMATDTQVYRPRQIGWLGLTRSEQ
jgi:uncharacterized protein (TIGR03089 family)